MDRWMKTLPQPWTGATEATVVTGWIYDHLRPHAAALKVAHPLMLRAIAAAKKKNDRIDASKICDCLRCDFLPECYMAPTALRERRRTLRYRKGNANRATLAVARKLAAINRRRGRTEGEIDSPLQRLWARDRPRKQKFATIKSPDLPRRIVMNQQRGTEDTLVLSYLELRKAVGIIGFALPFALAFGKILLQGRGIQSSISGYYYTDMRNVFVGSLCAIGVFLMSCRGY